MRRQPKKWKKLNTLKKGKKKQRKNKQVEGYGSRPENVNRNNKKIQTEGMQEMENLGTRTGTIDSSIVNRFQQEEERISGI